MKGFAQQHRGIDFIAELSPDVEGRAYIYTKENTSVANGMKITALNIDPAYELECIQPVLNGVSGDDGVNIDPTERIMETQIWKAKNILKEKRVVI